jgi:mRNA interferase RelE/StbE
MPVRGEPGVFRVRQGSYRIIYRIDEAALTVWIDKIGHRSDVY